MSPPENLAKMKTQKALVRLLHNINPNPTLLLLAKNIKKLIENFALAPLSERQIKRLYPIFKELKSDSFLTYETEKTWYDLETVALGEKLPKIPIRSKDIPKNIFGKQSQWHSQKNFEEECYSIPIDKSVISSSYFPEEFDAVVDKQTNLTLIKQKGVNGYNLLDADGRITQPLINGKEMLTIPTTDNEVLKEIVNTIQEDLSSKKSAIEPLFKDYEYDFSEYQLPLETLKLKTHQDNKARLDVTDHKVYMMKSSSDQINDDYISIYIVEDQKSGNCSLFNQKKEQITKYQYDDIFEAMNEIYEKIQSSE